jgi:hypothetical protein
MVQLKKTEPPQEMAPKVSKWVVVRAYYDALLGDLAAGDYGEVSYDGEQRETVKAGLRAAAARRNLKLLFLHKKGRTLFKVVEQMNRAEP